MSPWQLDQHLHTKFPTSNILSIARLPRLHTLLPRLRGSLLLTGILPIAEAEAEVGVINQEVETKAEAGHPAQREATLSIVPQRKVPI